MAPGIAFTYGALLNGAIVSNLFYGISCAQLISYYRTYNDGWTIKSFVATVWIIGTSQQCLIAHTVWYYLVSRCNGNSQGYLDANWSLIGETIPSEICFILVQFFFVVRIWQLGESKWAFILLVPAILGFASATAYIYEWYRFPMFHLDMKQFGLEARLVSIASASYALTDLLIAITMCYFLRKRRQWGFSASRSLISILIKYTISTGLLSSVVAIVYLTCYVVYGKTGNMVNDGVYFLHGPIYMNSMLASLNGRRALQARLSRRRVQEM